MSATEFISKLTIYSASQLPKTDVLSKIDPYLVVKLNGQQLKTSAKQDCDEPIWNTSYMVTLPRSASSFVGGTLEIVLYDENLVSDTMVGTAKVCLDELNPQQMARLTLPFTFAKEKFASQGRQSTVTVGFEGFVQSYASLRNMFSAMPGFMYDDKEHACYIPIMESNGLLYVAVEYEGGGKVDIKVFITQPNVPLYVDMLVLAGKQYTKVYRKSYASGRRLPPGLVVYEELKLDDLPIALDYNNLSVMVFDAQRLSSTNADTIVTAHGWKGALNFSQAARVLHSVEIDYEKEEIYMSVDPQETMLLVDYDRDDADIKLAVLANPATADKGYDITIKGHNYNKMSELYVPPRMKLGGRLPVCRLFELDDLPYGTRFDQIEIHRFQLSNPRQYTVQGLVRLHG